MHIRNASSTALEGNLNHDDVKPQLPPETEAKAKEAAEKFEAFFVTEMLRQMRKSTKEIAGEDSIYKDKVNEDMLDLADTLVADAIAKTHAFGIADVLIRQLLPSAASPEKKGDA